MIQPTDTSRILVCLIVAVVALAPVATGAAAAASTASIADSPTTDIDAETDGEMILEVVEETDETLTVELSTDLDNVVGYHANLYYDAEATEVQSVAGGEDSFEADPVDNVDNENGSVAFNQVALDNPSDAPTLATITFAVPEGETAIEFDIGGVDRVVDTHLAVEDDGDRFDLQKDSIVIGEEDDSEAPDEPDEPDAPDEPDEPDAPEEPDEPDAPDTPDEPNAPGGGGTSDGDSTSVSDVIVADVETSEGGVSMSANDVASGDTVEANLDGLTDDRTTIRDVSLRMSADVDRVSLDTELLSDRPDDVNELGGSEPVTYVEFTPDGFESADLESASVSFEVNGDSLPDDTSHNDVRLHRYTDDGWETVETTHEGDGTYVAETPGFSYFAVGAAQADTSVTDASMSSDTVDVGDEVTVEGTIENTGNADGDETVTLLVDGEIMEERDVSVAAGEETTTTFSFTFDDAGDYDLSVDDVDVGTLSVSDDGTEDSTDAGTDDTDSATPDDEAAAADGSESALEPFGGSLAALIGLIALVAIAVAGVAIWRQ